LPEAPGGRGVGLRHLLLHLHEGFQRRLDLQRDVDGIARSLDEVRLTNAVKNRKRILVSEFIAEIGAAAALQAGGMSGIRIADAEISTDLEYDDAYPNRPLPPFAWLQIVGKPGQDDFGMARNHHLVLSERALQILSPFGIAHAHMAPFLQDDGVVPEPLTFDYIVSHE
jgi:hypothetical protein